MTRLRGVFSGRTDSHASKRGPHIMSMPAPPPQMVSST